MALFKRNSQIQKKPVEARSVNFTRFDSIFARLRRIDERLGALEAKCSELRRDVNRVEKQQSLSRLKGAMPYLPKGDIAVRTPEDDSDFWREALRNDGRRDSEPVS